MEEELSPRRRVLRLLVHRRRGRPPRLRAPHVAAAPPAALLRPLGGRCRRACVPRRASRSRCARASPSCSTRARRGRASNCRAAPAAARSVARGFRRILMKAAAGVGAGAAAVPGARRWRSTRPPARAAARARRRRRAVTSSSSMARGGGEGHRESARAAAPPVCPEARATTDLPRHPPRARRGAAQHVRFVAAVLALEGDPSLFSTSSRCCRSLSRSRWANARRRRPRQPEGAQRGGGRRRTDEALTHFWKTAPDIGYKGRVTHHARERRAVGERVEVLRHKLGRVAPKCRVAHGHPRQRHHVRQRRERRRRRPAVLAQRLLAATHAARAGQHPPGQVSTMAQRRACGQHLLEVAVLMGPALTGTMNVHQARGDEREEARSQLRRGVHSCCLQFLCARCHRRDASWARHRGRAAAVLARHVHLDQRDERAAVDRLARNPGRRFNGAPLLSRPRAFCARRRPRTRHRVLANLRSRDAQSRVWTGLSTPVSCATEPLLPLQAHVLPPTTAAPGRGIRRLAPATAAYKVQHREVAPKTGAPNLRGERHVHHLGQARRAHAGHGLRGARASAPDPSTVWHRTALVVRSAGGPPHLENRGDECEPDLLYNHTGSIWPTSSSSRRCRAAAILCKINASVTTRYCVHHERRPAYADYVSCNGNDTEHYDCYCNNWIDRIGRLDTSVCNALCPTPRRCRHARARRLLAESASTGRMPVYNPFPHHHHTSGAPPLPDCNVPPSANRPSGYWYSLPAAAECAAGGRTGCSWERRTWQHFVRPAAARQGLQHERGDGHAAAKANAAVIEKVIAEHAPRCCMC